jgi:hypothetical protein
MSTSYADVAFATILAIVFIAFQLFSRRQLLRRGPVWVGGLRHLWPEITDTATGFSNPVRVIFEAILQPAAGEDSLEAVAEHFRTPIKRNRTEVHIVDRLVLDPAIASMRRVAAVAQKMHGKCQCLCGLRPPDDTVALIVAAVLF